MKCKASDIVEALIKRAKESDLIWVEELRLNSGSSRVDFWTMKPHASTGFNAVSYEIKVSKQDFKKDSLEKQTQALSFCDKFYFVMPVGLIDKSEIPEWAGLIEYNGLLKVVKRAPKKEQKSHPNWDFVTSILRNSAKFGRDTDIFRKQISDLQVNLAQEKRETVIFKRLYERSVEKIQGE